MSARRPECTNVPIRAKEPTINFAIGPNCPVRCECYNYFGDTAKLGGLVTAEEVIDFVGTVLLGDAPILYKGRGTVAKVEVSDIAPYTDRANIPLDGATQETINTFRHGRPNLLHETRLVAGVLRSTGVLFGFNTTANAGNIGELAAIRDIAEEEGAVEWQVFEYDPNGPNPTNKKDALRLAPGQFDEATNGLVSTSGNLQIVCKSLQARSGMYFMVNDAGTAWKPREQGGQDIIGHITADREQVLAALRRHIEGLRYNSKTLPVSGA